MVKVLVNNRENGDSNLESAIRNFRRKTQRAGIVSEGRRRMEHESAADEKKRKAKENKKRRMKKRRGNS